MSKQKKTKSKLWTKEQKNFVRENIDKLTLEQLAEQLGRTENAVRLFIHRDRIVYRQAVKNNLIVKMLAYKFTDPKYFRPTREFFDEIGISQMRFWKLYRGEVSPTEAEYKMLIKHFNIDKHEMFNYRQLDLFD